MEIYAGLEVNVARPQSKKERPGQSHKIKITYNQTII